MSNLGSLTDVKVKGQQKNTNCTAKSTPTKLDQQTSNSTGEMLEVSGGLIEVQA